MSYRNLLFPLLVLTACQSEVYSTRYDLLGIPMEEPALVREVDNQCLEFSLNYFQESFDTGKWVDHSQVKLTAVEFVQDSLEDQKTLSVPISEVEFNPASMDLSNQGLVDLSSNLFTRPSFKSTGKVCSSELQTLDLKSPFTIELRGEITLKDSKKTIKFDKKRFVNPTLTDAGFNTIYDGNIVAIPVDNTADEISIPVNLVDIRTERSSYIPPADLVPLKGMNAIWKQCKIQFELSQSLQIDLTSVKRFQDAPLLPQSMSPEAFELLKNIKSKIHDPNRSFTILFGNPFYKEFLSGDAGFAIGHRQILDGLKNHYGIETGDWSTVVMASDFMRPEIHFENPFAHKIQQTAAHEIGHLLIQAGHESDKTNLMASGGDREKTKLSKKQCDVARESAMKLLKGETLKSPIRI